MRCRVFVLPREGFCLRGLSWESACAVLCCAVLGCFVCFAVVELGICVEVLSVVLFATPFCVSSPCCVVLVLYGPCAQVSVVDVHIHTHRRVKEYVWICVDMCVYLAYVHRGRYSKH